MQLFNFFKRKPRKIGIALSGGATHGGAHIGVLQVLEKAGIQPEIIAGTSAGAIIGAAYAAGVDLEFMSKLFCKVKWPDLLRFSMNRHPSLFDTGPMEDFLRVNIGDYTFDQLPKPFAAIGCDITTGKRVVLKEGPLALAVRASAAIPGLFPPVEWKDRLLVDGGLVDNLPVEEVREMGANYIIAVDLTSHGMTDRRPTSAMEVFIAMINIMQSRSSLPDFETIDCYIRPEVSRFPAWNFDEARAVEEAGRVAALEVLPQLKRDLQMR